ncbi:MAG: hypothetical protein QW714_00285 [Nanopusillaceae archaeon]
MPETYTKAICRIQGYGKGQPGYQLIGVTRGIRVYLGGGSSTGPVFTLLEKGTAASPQEAARVCLEKARARGLTATVVAPQKHPKNKMGHGELYRLGLGDIAFRIKAAHNRKIAVVPSGIVAKLLTAKRSRSGAKAMIKRAR